MKKNFPLSATALAAVIALTGCGSEDAAQAPGMEHSTMGSTQGAAPTSGASNGSGDAEVPAKHNKADVKFAKMMSVHHTQAVTMSNIILDKEDIDPRVTDLAKEIKAAQGPEIDTMTSWLKAWGEPVPDHGHAMENMDSMDGMVSDQKMQQFKNAEGTEAARLFLSNMIEHHKGAVTMAQQEVENGTDPEAISLAKDMIKAQQAEIETMNDLLGALQPD